MEYKYNPLNDTKFKLTSVKSIFHQKNTKRKLTSTKYKKYIPLKNAKWKLNNTKNFDFHKKISNFQLSIFPSKKDPPQEDK
jgi:hypothetical protein